MFVITNQSYRFWSIQAQVLKSYSSKLTFTNLQCLSSAIQSFVVAIALERDPRQWKLGWDLRLLTVVYCVSRQIILGRVFPVHWMVWYPKPTWVKKKKVIWMTWRKRKFWTSQFDIELFGLTLIFLLKLIDWYLNRDRKFYMVNDLMYMNSLPSFFSFFMFEFA